MTYCELCVYDPMVKRFRFKTWRDYEEHMKTRHNLEVSRDGGPTWKPEGRREKPDQPED